MKTILITGVNRGIGGELAKLFLKNDWYVVGTVRNLSQEIDADSFVNFTKFELDLSSFQSMNVLIEGVKDRTFDVVVNNAGVMDSNSMQDPVYDSEERLMNVYMVNTIAPYVLSEKLIPYLNKENALVVSISSLLSKMDHILAPHWVYGSSKAALNYSMNAFAQTYPDIKSVLVRPGWVSTDMGGKNAPITPQEAAQVIFDNIENHEEKLPANTMVGPDGDITYF